MYVFGEGNPKDTFKWSAALSLFSLEPFQTRLSMNAEVSWLVSPDTLLGAVLSSRSGIFDVGTLNLYNLGDDLKVDNLDVSYGQKLSDRDEINATISEGWFTDGNTRDRAVFEYLYRVNDTPLVRIGGEYEYLTFSLDNANYWAPRPYSSISFVALIDDNDADETFFYRGKAAIGRVIEAAQTELSLDGEVTYNISSNFSAEMVLAVALGSTGDARSTLTSITLGVTYHF